MADDGLKGADDLMRRFEALGSGKADRLILGQFGLLAVQRSAELVHRRTGNLARTIRVAEVDEQNQRVRVTAGGSRTVGYAAAEEFGVAARVIVPRVRKALAWGGDRRLSGSLRKGARPTNFAKRVRQPARPPHPFLRPGAERALQDVGLADAVIKTWNEAA